MAVAVAESNASRKERGGIYTPPAIARFLSNWAIRRRVDRVLEPSCGDGVFVAAALGRLAELHTVTPAGQIVAIERDSTEFEKARRAFPDVDIRNASFFDVDPADAPRCDAVVGNPPYIRYHGFTGSERTHALERARAQGVNLSNLASSWAHFVIHAGSFLAADGRLALVLPAELLHTDYGAPVREWLLKRFRSVCVITFDSVAFAEAQVDALLVLASQDSEAGLRILRVADAKDLSALDVRTIPSGTERVVRARWSSSVDVDVRALYEEQVSTTGARRLGLVAQVDIGVVTGANRFFVMDRDAARARRLPDRTLLPIIESASAAPGLTLTPGATRRLLWIPNGVQHRSVARYLAEGEQLGVPGGYKCRTRSPWYRVPLPRTRPDAFLPYMHQHVPRLIVNRARAWSTNLLHGVVVRDKDLDVRVLSASMLSALTLLSAELEGRAYGGGVLKLETREAERLLVPNPATPAIRADLIKAFPRLSSLVRAGEWQTASNEVDAIVGLDHRPLAEAAALFRQRRLGRKGPSAAV